MSTNNSIDLDNVLGSEMVERMPTVSDGLVN